MFSSLSNLSSSTSSSSTSSDTAEVFGAVQTQSSEEKIPWTSKEEVEKKLASALSQVQQNQIKRLDLTATTLGRFYELAHTLNGNNNTVCSLAALPNNQLISGSLDATIALWDMSSRSCLSILRGHTDLVWTLVVLPNGQIASGSRDSSIKLWDLASHSCLSTLKGHGDGVRTLAVLPNGQLASGSYDTTIKLWDLASHACLATLQGHTNSVEALSVLPNGQLASSSRDTAIKIWDLDTHFCLATLEGHTSWAFALAVLPNGRLASSSGDKTIKIWDLASHSCLTTLWGHTDVVWALAVLSNRQLISGSWDNTIKLWDLASYCCLATLRGHTHGVLALTILPTGQFASSSKGKNIKLWESRTLSTKQLSPILNALKNNTSVKNLDLSGNRDILDDIIDPLIDIFKKSGFFSFFSSKPTTTLKTIDLRGTGVSKQGVKKLEKAIQQQRLSIEVLADCPIEWKMIYFLIVFCRANRNSPFADSGLDLCKHELGPFLGAPSGFFARPHKSSSSSNAKPATPSPS